MRGRVRGGRQAELDPLDELVAHAAGDLSAEAAAAALFANAAPASVFADRTAAALFANAVCAPVFTDLTAAARFALAAPAPVFADLPGPGSSDSTPLKGSSAR